MLSGKVGETVGVFPNCRRNILKNDDIWTVQQEWTLNGGQSFKQLLQKFGGGGVGYAESLSQVMPNVWYHTAAYTV